MVKKIFLILFILFIILQFFQPAKPEVKTDNPDDLIINNPDIPADISMILRTSCYDCHSNETSYPWYSNISPVSFLVIRDIEVGRGELNFSQWESLSKLEKAGALDDIIGAVGEGEMPMKIYTAIHRDAMLSDNDVDLLVSWAENYSEKIFE